MGLSFEMSGDGSPANTEHPQGRCAIAFAR